MRLNIAEVGIFSTMGSKRGGEAKNDGIGKFPRENLYYSGLWCIVKYIVWRWSFFAMVRTSQAEDSRRF